MIDIEKTKNLSWQIREYLKRNEGIETVIIIIHKENVEKLIDTIDFLVQRRLS